MKGTHILAWLLVLLTVLPVSFPAYTEDMNSDLWLAAQEGKTAKVKALLEQGADVNSKDKNGWTALMYAAAYDYRCECKEQEGGDGGRLCGQKCGRTISVASGSFNYSGRQELGNNQDYRLLR